MSSHGRGERLLADLGLRLTIQCTDANLGGIVRREVGGLLVPELTGGVQVRVELRRLEQPCPDGTLRADDQGWDLTTWGVRMRLDLGQAGGPSTIQAQVSTDDPLSLHLALQDALYLICPHHGALMLHAAAAELDGEALVISGEKDAGKTTTCRNAPASARIMGDEGIVCIPGQQGATAHATPFHSDEYAFTPEPGSRPVRALVHLVRGPRGLRRLGPGQALWPLMRASGRLGGPASPSLLELMARLVEGVPCWELSSDHPDQVWPLLGEVK
jgi:hypothetical protein